MRFLCGCNADEKREDVVNNPATFDTVAVDDEGYLICKFHRQRQQGWRSDSYVTMTLDGKSFFRTFDETQARIDRDLPPLVWPEFVPLAPMHDWRDNRDPQEIAEWLLSGGPPGMSLSDKYDLGTGQNMPPLPEPKPYSDVLNNGRTLMAYHRRIATKEAA